MKYYVKKLILSIILGVTSTNIAFGESIFLSGQTQEGYVCNIQISKDKDLHTYAFNLDNVVYRFVTFEPANQLEGKFIENRYGVTKSVFNEPKFYLGAYSELNVKLEFSVGLARIHRKSLKVFKIGQERELEENLLCVFD